VPAGPEPVSLPSGLVRELTRFSSRRRPVWECDISHATTLERRFRWRCLIFFNSASSVPYRPSSVGASPRLNSLKRGRGFCPGSRRPRACVPSVVWDWDLFVWGFHSAVSRPPTVVSKRMFLLNQPMLTTYPLLASLRGKRIFFLMPRWNVSIHVTAVILS
jgi:hypothetical protein